MDTLTRTLLIEVARTVLRVLEPAKADPTRNGCIPLDLTNPTPNDLRTPVPVKLATPAPVVAAAVAALHPKLGDTVRVWSGDKYVVGVVDRLMRTTPAKARVRISRGEGRRNKLVVAQCDSLVVLTPNK